VEVADVKVAAEAKRLVEVLFVVEALVASTVVKVGVVVTPIVDVPVRTMLDPCVKRVFGLV
jgi:hypothetical protein